MGLRAFIRRLERLSEGEVIVIPQKDGTVARFPQSAARDAFTNLMDRMGAGADAPPEHPLIAAARNSSEPEWAESIYAVEDPAAHVAPVEDRSES
jgi:hypothetical protein